MDNNKKKAVRITAIVLAIVILAVAIFLIVWFATRTGTNDDVAYVDNTENAGGDSSGNGGSQNGSGSTDSTGSSSDKKGTVHLTRDLTDIDIQNLTDAMSAVRVYNSSYYGTSTVTITDNLTGDASTTDTKVAYDMDNFSLSIEEACKDSETNYDNTLYIFSDNGSLTIYEDHTDNLDGNKSSKTALSDDNGIYSYLYEMYTDCFVGSMLSLSSDDVFMTSNGLTVYDIEEFMEQYLHYAMTVSDYLTSGVTFDDEEKYQTCLYLLYNGLETMQIYDAEDGEEEGTYTYVYSYSKDASLDGYAYQYVSATALTLVNGYVTERTTQEELVVTNMSGETVFDSTYTNEVTVAYECDASLFDVDFTVYDGYVAPSAEEPEDGEGTEQTGND